jgi:AsmA family protein
MADTRARVDGKLMEPVKLAAGKVNFSLQGPGLKMLSSFLGPSAPQLPAYDVEGQVTRAGQIWRVRGFRAEVGKSDLTGAIGINTNGKLPFIKADLVSHRLDYADFQTVMGAKDGKKNANGAEQQSKKGAARTAGESPEPLFNLGPLQKFNAQVSFKGKNVIAPNLPLEGVALDIALQDGRLAIKPFNLGVAGGDIRSQVQLDSSGRPARTVLQAEVSQVNLKEIVRGSGFAQKSVGNIGGRAHLNATGDSIAAFMATLDGQLSLAMEGGTIDSLLLQLANLDVLQAVSGLVGDEKGVPIECAFTHFKARNGQVDIESFLVVTKDTYFTADGSIDLDKERINVIIYPHPIHFSLFATRTPLHISGRLSDPKFYPDYPGIAVRIAASVVLGIVATPLAALIPLVGRGTGNNPTCSTLLTTVKEQQSANKSPRSDQEVQSPASFIERRHGL